MPSRKFQSGLANTLANFLFGQYAQEDAAKASEQERAFTTSRDRAKRLHEEKMDIRGDMEARNRVLEKSRLEGQQKFLDSQRDAAAAAKQLEFDRWKAQLDAATRKKVAATRAGGDKTSEKVKLWKSELAGLSIDYNDAIARRDYEGAANIAARYKRVARLANTSGELSVPDTLEEFSAPIVKDDDVVTEGPGIGELLFGQPGSDITASPIENIGKNLGAGLRQSILGGGEQAQTPQVAGPLSAHQPTVDYEDGEIVILSDGSQGIVINGQVYQYTEELKNALNF